MLIMGILEQIANDKEYTSINAHQFVAEKLQWCHHLPFQAETKFIIYVNFTTIELTSEGVVSGPRWFPSNINLIVFI